LPGTPLALENDHYQKHWVCLWIS